MRTKGKIGLDWAAAGPSLHVPCDIKISYEELGDGCLIADKLAPKFVVASTATYDQFVRIELPINFQPGKSINPEGQAARDEAFSKFTEMERPVIERADQSILKYAKRWGMMGVCEHGLPCSHADCLPLTVRKDGKEYYVEPLGFLRKIIRKVQILRTIGNSIQTGGKGDQNDWLALEGFGQVGLSSETMNKMSADKIEDFKKRNNPWKFDWKESPDDDWPPPGNLDLDPVALRRPTRARPQDIARKMFAGHINDLLRLGNVIPQLEWDVPKIEGKKVPLEGRWMLRPSVPVSGRPLFGWLALSLAMEMIYPGKAKAFCPYCKAYYGTDRRPTSGQLNCCGEENCLKARDAEQRRRQRKDPERRLKRQEAERQRWQRRKQAKPAGAAN